jgi:hypothetical protein
MDPTDAAHCLARQDQFTEALLTDKPLVPGEGGWTFGDLIFLGALMDVLTESAGQHDLTLPIRNFISRRS